MAFVSVPKDLSKISVKQAFGLTKRQLICFGSAAAIGVPAYILTRGAIGNSAAALLMIGLMLPLFFVGVYEKDGQRAEKILRNFVRTRFLWPGKRVYKTENLYEIMSEQSREGVPIAGKNKETAKTRKPPVRKRKAGKGRPR